MKRTHGQIIFESLWPNLKPKDWSEVSEMGKAAYEKSAVSLRRQILDELRIVARDPHLDGSFHLILLNYELEKSK